MLTVDLKKNALVDWLMRVIICAIAGSTVGFASADETLTFNGAWFSVDYPADFKPRPSLVSSSGNGYDSAFFESPDGRTSFYLFAPQWTGTAKDIAIDPDTEVLKAERSSLAGQVKTSWRTIEAADGSYTRSYQTTEDARGPSSWTVGWRYGSAADLARWREAYLAFKASIELFAD